MYITKQELERDFDLFPNYVVSDKYKNSVRVVGKIILHRETQLNVDETKAQIRQGDDLKARTTELKREFDTVGIDYNVPIPQVSLNSELKKYDLESGFGRDGLFDEVNQEHYIYTLIEYLKPEDARSYRLSLNEQRAARFNKTQDYIYNISQEVESGIISATDSSIKEYMSRIGSTHSEHTKTEIVEAVQELTNQGKTLAKFKGYTDSTFPRFIRDYWEPAERLRFNFEHNGELNGKYGVFFTHPYVRDNLSQAVDRYMKYGLKTLAVVACRIQDVTGIDKLNSLRKRVFKDVKNIQERMNNFYGKPNFSSWDEAFEIIGFAPQDTKNEDMTERKTKLISPEQFKV
tara:strand:+ start:62 stop:1099 length:1038 start_codon:yes stop_codon:yes gene_type:complete